jgi:Domain of unknown function (DUF4129)
MRRMDVLREDSWESSDRPKAVQVIGGGVSQRRALPVAVVGVLAGLACAVVAAASAELLSRLRGEVPTISSSSAVGYVTAALLAGLLLAFVGLAYLSWLERAREPRAREPAVREDAEPQRGRYWPVLLLLPLFTALVSLAIVLGSLYGRPGEREPPTPTLPSQAQPPLRTPADGTAGGWPVHWILLAALSCVGGTFAAFVLVRHRRRRRAARPLTAEEELVVVVDQSLDELESEPDPRLAVIRAYARMERSLAFEGAGRRPPETPLEYLARVLASVRVSRGSIARLTSLFQDAKFSRHAIDATMKGEAVAALRELREELDSSNVRATR